MKIDCQVLKVFSTRSPILSRYTLKGGDIIVDFFISIWRATARD